MMRCAGPAVRAGAGPASDSVDRRAEQHGLGGAARQGGDRAADDTAAFQRALDEAGKAGGGVVYAPRGNYLFKGNLLVPNGVTLKGVWESVPAHNGIRDAGLPKPTDDGTTFLVTPGAGNEEGPAFITLNTNSTLKGVVLYYPNQKTDDVPTPYPWAIAMRGKPRLAERIEEALR